MMPRPSNCGVANTKRAGRRISKARKNLKYTRSYLTMKQSLSRRNFFQSSALLAMACAAPNAVPAFAEPKQASGKPSPVHLGLATYTFRNFTRTQMIGYLKQLNLADLNVKDVKDHLPMDQADRKSTR